LGNGAFFSPKASPDREFWGTNFGDDAMTNNEEDLSIRLTFECIRGNAESFCRRGVIGKDGLKFFLAVLERSYDCYEAANGKLELLTEQGEVM